MSILKRYRKHGGLEELVKLVELSSRDAQERMLKSIEEEDATFAAEIRKRLFFFEDLFYQDQRVTEKLLDSVPSKVWAYALLSYGENEKDEIFSLAKLTSIREIKDEIEALKHSATLAQSISARKKIVSEARKLEEEGHFKLEKLERPAPGLKIAEVNPGGKGEKQTEEQGTTPHTGAFVSVSIGRFAPDEKLKCDLYTIKNDQFAVIKKKGETLNAREIEHLRKIKLSCAFIALDDVSTYYEMP